MGTYRQFALPPPPLAFSVCFVAVSRSASRWVGLGRSIGRRAGRSFGRMARRPVGRLVGRSAGQIGRSVGLPVDQSAEGSVSWFSDRSESRYIYNFGQYGAVVWLRTSISGSHDRSVTGWRDGRSAGWSAGRPGQIGRSIDLLVGRSAGGSVGWPADRSEARHILHTAFAYLRPSRIEQNASSPVFVVSQSELRT